jgi:hypothetical protein
MTATNKSMNMSSSSDSKTAKVDCLICIEEVFHTKIVKCPYCNFESCLKCVGTFLLGIDDDRPRCMNNICKKVWTYEFLADNFESAFYNKKYRDRRAVLLQEREKSLLPGTQPLVVAEKKREENAKKIADIRDENDMYRELIRQNENKINSIFIKQEEEENGITIKKKDTKTFIRACPVDDCRGFLSTGLKCGTCNGYSCKDCHLPKAGKHDEDHKCDPDLIATVKLLASDTKSCPGCSTPIFKIEGCDQMYCTKCHTAFSWKRGTIERGVIHNPHFYESQRAMNGGIAPTRNVAMRCGGPPAIFDIQESLLQANVEFKYCFHAHMLIEHINMVELENYPNTIGEMDNSKLRVDYLMNRITEKQWISKLKTKMKKQEKNGEFNMVLSMFTTTMSDLFGNIEESDNAEDIIIYILSMNELREYTNKSLKNIGMRYENIFPVICPKFKFCRKSKNYDQMKKRWDTMPMMPIMTIHDM